MESQNHYQGIPSYAISTVRHHARRLARSPGFFPADVEDIEQELMLDLHRHLPRHNPGRAAINTFIAKLVENHAATLVEQIQTAKRGGSIMLVSLQETVTTDEVGDVELGEILPSHIALWNDGELSSFDAIDLRLAIERALHALPPHLQMIAAKLMKESFSEVAVATGIPRSSLYDAASRIRSCLMKGGFGEKFSGRPTN